MPFLKIKLTKAIINRYSLKYGTAYKTLEKSSWFSKNPKRFVQI